MAERYADRADMQLAVARAYAAAPKWGHEAAGEFRRGAGVGPRVFFNEADRFRCLRHARLALEAIDASGSDDQRLASDACALLEEQLRLDRDGRYAWRLQRKTDLDGEPPEPTTDWSARGAASDPPVTDDGDRPLLYDAPESWAAATSDGERWRWALAERARRDPSRRAETELAYADFLRQQFGVQTAAAGWRPMPLEEDDMASTALSVKTLGDDETIARLATGVRRFRLPEGHHFIDVYRRHGKWATLHEVYVNRNQRGKALEAARRWLDTASNKRERQSAQQAIDQLSAPWVRLDRVETQPAGAATTIRVTHRNTASARFVAKRLDVGRLLDDVRAALADGEMEDRRELAVEGLGWRLVQGSLGRYTDDEESLWTVEIDTPADHADGMAAVASPLQDAGAYLVTVTPLDATGGEGAATSVVVWVADTALVRKPTANGWLYQVLDARDGRPVADAELSLFGFGEGDRPAGAGGDRPWFTKRFAARTDGDGVAQFAVLDEEENSQRLSWLATATTDGGRLAHLGFANIWRRRVASDPPRDTRAFVVTDRPIYRPGDTAQIKVWVGRPDYTAPISEPGGEAVVSPFAHQEFQLVVRDNRGETVLQERRTADLYGAVATECALAEGAPLGAYSIEVVGFGGGSFRVEEYRKPEFEVAVDAPEEPTRLGETFEATVTASYYSGAPVRGGSVSYKVVRTSRSEHWLPPRPWDWLYGRGYGWLGQDAAWRADWGRWGCIAPPPWWAPWSAGPPEVVAEGQAMLDGDGRFRLPIDTTLAAEQHPGEDHRYQITAEVTDAGRRTVAGEGAVLAARRPVEVTVWLDRGFYDVGDTVLARLSVRRPDGQPIAAPGELRLLKVAPQASDEAAGETPSELPPPKETVVQTWRLASDAGAAATMRLKASEPGRYRLVYRSDAVDAETPPAEGGSLFTIRGPGFDGSGFRFGALELVPDKSEYRPGDTVRLAINTDRLGSTVSLYVRPVGTVYGPPRVVTLEGKTTIVELPVTDADLPNFYVEATTVSDGRVHTIARSIAVPPESRVIDVAASTSAATYLPGEEGTLRVRLTGADGAPVVGQAAIAVYDRSVEAIAGGPSGGDIRESFWRWTRRHNPQTTHNLDRVESAVALKGVPTMRRLGVFGGPEATPVDFMMSRRQRGLGMAFGAVPEMADAAPPMALATSAAAPPQAEPSYVRRDFADTAVWIAAVETDSDGLAEVKLPLPESLSSWKVRVWAVSAGLRVGQGETEVVTRKDLMVRLRTPRFLVEGDESVLAALVQNESDTPQTVRVQFTALGDRLASAEPSTRTVDVPPRGELLVDWPVTAAAEGIATVRVVAEGLVDGETVAALSDGVEQTLPVLVHGAEIVESYSAVIGPDERFATFELIVPDERRPESTRLEVRYSPTLVGAMLETLPYLIEYPHGCTEQTLNRFLPAVLVRSTLERLGVDLAELAGGAEGDAAQPPGRANPVFDADELDQIVATGVRRLGSMQLGDGGWGWFSGRGARSQPHTTAVVVRGLALARAAGVEVPQRLIDGGVAWLERYREEQIRQLDAWADEDVPSWQKKRYADNLDALVELTLGESDRPSERMLTQLFDDRLRLSTYSLAMVGLAWANEAERADVVDEAREQAVGYRDRVIRNLRQFVVEDDENQTAVLDLPSTPWWRWYGSTYEAQAYFLKLLVVTEPKGDLAPRLVKHLLASRRRATRWNSTRDTALVVEAMADYVLASGEAAEPGAVEVWLNGRRRDAVEYAAEDALRFEGRFVLEGEQLPTGRHTLELRKTGAGRLYAGASLVNFSLEDDLRAAGLEVRVGRRVQRLERVDAVGEDVDARGGLLDPAVQRYRRIDVPNLGAVDTGDLVEVELTITSKNDYEYLVLEDYKPAGFEPVAVRSGYDGAALGAYVEYRDETVRFYLGRLARGEQTVRYRLRAETPGRYAALPAQMSAMYAPELRGNSDEIRIEIEDAVE